MYSAMYIGVGLSGKSIPQIQYGLWSLGCGGIVKINQLLSINLTGKQRKHLTYFIYRNHNRPVIV